MKYTIALLSLCALPAFANVDIVGNVEAKCVIQTDKSGVYGNPTAPVLSTTPADGGVLPVIRFDVALANYYTANITHPSSFSSSPSLTDKCNMDRFNICYYIHLMQVCQVMMRLK